MRKLSDTDQEIAALQKQALALGVTEEALKAIASASGTREDHIADLKAVTRPNEQLHTAPNPPYERHLEPHEESIFEEMLAGEHVSETTVG
ncbi:MAG TPA: hypothetical protein VMU38_06625 [Candidatus Binatia bacterium]|nr:hypothetical protein [Candidatus Binatia bacterium]